MFPVGIDLRKNTWIFACFMTVSLMRLFRFLLLPHISSDNFFIHSHRTDKVASGPKMVSPLLTPDKWKTVIQPRWHCVLLDDPSELISRS